MTKGSKTVLIVVAMPWHNGKSKGDGGSRCALWLAAEAVAAVRGDVAPVADGSQRDEEAPARES
jgi:hypothetical protein